MSFPATLDGIRPADLEFHKVRELLREIQLSGMVRLYVKEDASKQQATLLAFRTDHIPPESRPPPWNCADCFA